MFAFSDGINWVNYIEFEFVGEKVRILNNSRAHKYEDRGCHIKKDDLFGDYEIITTNDRKDYIRENGGLAELAKDPVKRKKVFQISPDNGRIVGIKINSKFYEN